MSYMRQLYIDTIVNPPIDKTLTKLNLAFRPCNFNASYNYFAKF